MCLSGDFPAQFQQHGDFIKAALSILGGQVASLAMYHVHTHTCTLTHAPPGPARETSRMRDEGVWMVGLAGRYQYGVVARRICRAMEKQGSCATL